MKCHPVLVGTGDLSFVNESLSLLELTKQDMSEVSVVKCPTCKEYHIIKWLGKKCS